jgi:hypothetical protein
MPDKDNFQHNTVVVGSRVNALEGLRDFFSLNGLYYERSDFELSVDEVREARRWIVGVGDEKSIVVLSSFYWNEEVQNALLKVLEDTPPDCTIILLGHKKSFFLPTVLSRVQVLELETENSYEDLSKNLLSQPSYLRLQDSKLKKLLAKKIESVEDDSERKDREAQILLFESLFAKVISSWRLDRDKFEKSYINQLLKLSENIYNYGGNPTLSIEYLLLTAPVL